MKATPETIERLKAVLVALYDLAEPCTGLATLFNQDGHAYEPDPGWMIGVSTILRKLSDLGYEQISELTAVIGEIEEGDSG